MVNAINIDTAVGYVQQLLSDHDLDGAVQYVRSLHPVDRAEILTWLESDQQAMLVELLNIPELAELFEQLHEDDMADVAQHLDVEQLADVLDEMEPDVAADLISELEPAEAAEVLEQMDESGPVSKLLTYDPDTAGGIMNAPPPSLRRQMTVAMAFDFLKKHYRDASEIYYLYVLDRFGHLIGLVNLRALILADPNQTVEEIMTRNVITANVDMDQESVATLLARYDLLAVPVVDDENMLVGIITVDDVMDVAEEEATEDIQKLGGLEALDEPYMQIHFLRMVRKRAGWLVILFLGEMLTATAMGFYEHEIARAVVLALFVPLIISSGGNSGSQASTLVIRAMALGEVNLRDWWQVMHRELMAGLMLGSILGLIGFLRITLWSLVSDLYGPHWLLVALTVSIALIGIVLWGTLAGSMLPFLLRRLGLDPATSSAPFVATLVDVSGLIIYFTIASLILRGTLL
jgi:magnesium transporter